MATAFGCEIHGVLMARFQYVWHGLTPHATPPSLFTSTTLWVRPQTRELLNACVHDAAQPSVCVNTDDNDATAGALVPDRGTNWAFFDNYHALHHIAPRSLLGISDATPGSVARGTVASVRLS